MGKAAQCMAKYREAGAATELIMATWTGDRKDTLITGATTQDPLARWYGELTDLAETAAEQVGVPALLALVPKLSA